MWVEQIRMVDQIKMVDQIRMVGAFLVIVELQDPPVLTIWGLFFLCTQKTLSKEREKRSKTI